MENSSEEKRLQATSFVLHGTRGVIRDQTTRRKAMFLLVLGALVLLFSGTTFLQSWLNSRQHPVWFLLFWIVCAWLTLTALLLAIFDLLVVRLEARKVQRQLRKTFDRSRSNQ
jgi:hypothetical protein